MTGQELIGIASIVVPVILATVVDGIRTRTQVAVLAARQQDDRERITKIVAWQEAHEGSRMHVRRGPVDAHQ